MSKYFLEGKPNGEIFYIKFNFSEPLEQGLSLFKQDDIICIESMYHSSYLRF